MSGLAELLDECDAQGIRLIPSGNGGLTIDAPDDALTPGLMARLTTHKADLLAFLRPMPIAFPDTSIAIQDTPAMPSTAVCRCGSTKWRDVPIHGGKSIRRDCARCDRFISFPVWYGKQYFTQ